MDETRFFILPGLNNSGSGHWQTKWEEAYQFTRIEQDEWDHPVAEKWITTIEHATCMYQPQQLVFIGHSLACCTIVRWAARYRHVIKAALLVAPSDTEAVSFPTGTSGFTPMPVNKLLFPSVVVASSDDPYITMERAAFFASAWGSKFVTAGPLGHINAGSNIGAWEQGYQILQQLLNV